RRFNPPPKLDLAREVIMVPVCIASIPVSLASAIILICSFCSGARGGSLSGEFSTGLSVEFVPSEGIIEPSVGEQNFWPYKVLSSSSHEVRHSPVTVS